jgi:hypothetical protein
MSWFEVNTKTEHKMQQLETWRREADVQRQVREAKAANKEDSRSLDEPITRRTTRLPRMLKRMAVSLRAWISF